MNQTVRYGVPLFTIVCLLNLLLVFFWASTHHYICCSDDPELTYLLHPRPTQKFKYPVQYETFFSKQLGKEKGFFILLPEGFDQDSRARYPVLFLLHGYNFHRNGFGRKAYSPERAREILCQVKEEEYHWLLHEDVAVIAAAMMDSTNRTYRELEKSLGERFKELSDHGGLHRKDYTPKEIAQSIVSHNLHPKGNLSDSYAPIARMILALPDGDNSFYTDENEGKALFPETKESQGCDRFHQGEALSYSLLPFFYMKPGALGKHETYILEMVQYLESHPRYLERIRPQRGVGGISMGGLGAIKFGFKYPHFFHSVSSQSGLLDLELLNNKWMLKIVMPEFLEVFGRLDTNSLPPSSTLDLSYIRMNNPFTLAKENKLDRLPPSIYFDYGEKEGYHVITQGNRHFEQALREGSHQISVQPFNGKAGHNYQFWRSRVGNVLKHHSDHLQKGP